MALACHVKGALAWSGGWRVALEPRALSKDRDRVIEIEERREPQPPSAAADPDDDMTRWDLFDIWLYRQMWLSNVVLFIGIGLLLYDRWLGLLVIGAANVFAGLIPMITGMYFSKLWKLHGWRARVRGAIGVALGALVMALAYSRLWIS